MTEDEKLIAEMADGGIVDGLRWAVTSAHARAWADFDPETGHNQTVLGIAAHTLLVDRQDRVFRLERYIATNDGRDQDLLLAGLLPAERDTLPVLTGVERADLNNSPAWRYGRYRWFLSSFEHGKVHDIAWGRKSPTKRKIAAQTGTDSPDQIVMPGTYDEPVGHALDTITLRELLEANARDSVVNIVLAHSIDPHSGATELFVGKPRLNVGGGRPWVWLRSLLAGDGGSGSGAKPQSPAPTGPARGADVPDAPVRLRPRVAGRETAVESPGR
ncbi:hypothetical protein [Micromonospora sagamiensis]|uniref:Uncharacterized protein n=1 Tax=Micromonospora sagamiensis TaxID=47875 RepID=A0A562WR64_9ACTN|nr:hypothetical protein [Micromonospora sagamiensis]TWJ32307.1 hypothetical protein JD81_05882 [Micromonospora sagamiensis]BCL14628.1 hypothetical protein GCM10017556_23670 [Micromonospora sagamiensis]